jgi:hypothetical protein
MSRAPLLLLLCLLSLFTLVQISLAQASGTSATSSAVQVLYVLEPNSILTYDVDPQTLNATQVGTLTVDNPTYAFWLRTSPDGHFLYLVADDAQFNQHLYVYRTNALGAPQAPPTQAMTANGLWDLQFDPRANFAYTVNRIPKSNGYQATFTLKRFLVDPNTGRITQPVVQEKYVLDVDPSGQDCWVNVVGFDPRATMLYDAVVCGNRDTEGATYYERTLNAQTGALGPDVQIYNWLDGSGGFEWVEFIGGLMFDLVSPNDFQQGINYVNIYPRVPNTSQPILSCTANMLEECGYDSGHVHPSGKYLFMQASSNTYEIEKVELGQKKIVDTGNSILLDWFSQFSPNGSLVYGATTSSSSGYTIQIYGFDADTGTAATGGTIWDQGFAPFFSAQRY